MQGRWKAVCTQHNLAGIAYASLGSAWLGWVPIPYRSGALWFCLVGKVGCVGEWRIGIVIARCLSSGCCAPSVRVWLSRPSAQESDPPCRIAARSRSARRAFRHCWLTLSIICHPTGNKSEDNAGEDVCIWGVPCRCLSSRVSTSQFWSYQESY